MGERDKHRSPPKFDSIIAPALDVWYSCTAYIDVDTLDTSYVQLSPASHQSEWRGYCFLLWIVCLSVSSGAVNQTSLAVKC